MGTGGRAGPCILNASIRRRNDVVTRSFAVVLRDTFERSSIPIGRTHAITVNVTRVRTRIRTRTQVGDGKARLPDAASVPLATIDDRDVGFQLVDPLEGRWRHQP